MTKEQDLSSYASFDINDIVAEIKSKGTNKREVTAYLDRNFLDNMISKYHDQKNTYNLDFSVSQLVDLSEYNFTGTDFRGISFSDFQLFNFSECDISSVHLDRTGINFFHEYMINNDIIFQGINLEDANLGPIFCSDYKLGIKCNMYLNLSNLDFTGSNFSKCDIDGLILENTNISGCNFCDAKNLDPKQFAFSIGFETAVFNKDPQVDLELKKTIKHFSEKLNPESYYASQSAKPHRTFISFLADATNFLDN